MSPSRGNPIIAVRVEADFMARFQSAFPSVNGRSGGGSLALRRLLYALLDETMPRQFGELGRAHEVDALEARLREVELQPFVPAQAADLRASTRELLRDPSRDAVDALRLKALLGRLQLWETPLETSVSD